MGADEHVGLGHPTAGPMGRAVGVAAAALGAHGAVCVDSSDAQAVGAVLISSAGRPKGGVSATAAGGQGQAAREREQEEQEELERARHAQG